MLDWRGEEEGRENIFCRAAVIGRFLACQVAEAASRQIKYLTTSRHVEIELHLTSIPQLSARTAMASTNCLRCLARPAFPSPNILNATTRAGLGIQRRAASKLAKPSNTQGRKNEKVKGQKTLRIKKKAPVKTGKPPAPGERKAMRKRIVLSNTNALEVEGLRELDSKMLGEWEESVVRELQAGEDDLVMQGALGLLEGEGGEAKGEAKVVGKVVALMGSTVDSLRAVEAFKTTQGWGLFRRPGLLIREESVALSKKLILSEEGGVLRLVIDGERGTGKSLLLLHAMATAFVRGWVVVNIPEGELRIFFFGYVK